MPSDKRECPNGHRLLWQNRQMVTGREATPERFAEMPEIPRNPSESLVSACRIAHVFLFGVCPLLFRTVSVLDYVVVVLATGELLSR